VLAALRPLQARLYSISSSQLEAAGRVAVTVAVVRYASLGRPRIGVTSTFAAERVRVRPARRVVRHVLDSGGHGGRSSARAARGPPRVRARQRAGHGADSECAARGRWAKRRRFTCTGTRTSGCPPTPAGPSS